MTEGLPLGIAKINTTVGMTHSNKLPASLRQYTVLHPVTFISLATDIRVEFIVISPTYTQPEVLLYGLLIIDLVFSLVSVIRSTQQQSLRCDKSPF
jgi:hypothetical protein